eukprot:6213846-Pleurochrysis_carterae.AAC.3
MAAEIEELKAENQRLRDEITELKGITEPGKKYLNDDGFTLAVDLAIAEAIATAHVSRNQVPALLLIVYCSLLSDQAAEPPPQGAAQGRRWQDDA